VYSLEIRRKTLSSRPERSEASGVESLPCFAEAPSGAEGEVEGDLLFLCSLRNSTGKFIHEGGGILRLPLSRGRTRPELWKPVENLPAAPFREFERCTNDTPAATNRVIRLALQLYSWEIMFSNIA
jgi:hypothetical protein